MTRRGDARLLKELVHVLRIADAGIGEDDIRRVRLVHRILTRGPEQDCARHRNGGKNDERKQLSGGEGADIDAHFWNIARRGRVRKVAR